MAKTPETDNDIIHRLRNHIQIVGGLLRLHDDYVEEEKALELLRKLRTRLAALEETSFLTVERPHEAAAVRPVIEAMASAVGRIYDDRSRHRCVVDRGDFRLDAIELAVVGQIFAEFLSTIYSRRSLRDVATDVVTTIEHGADGLVTMSVRDLNFTPGQEAEPVDPLTSKMISALVDSIGGEAQFDEARVFDARFAFKARVEPVAE
jgi:two-component sensor histidine kinase